MGSGDGVFYPTRENNRRAIIRHLSAWTHLETEYSLKLAKQKLSQGKLEQIKQEDPLLFATNRVIHGVYAMMKMGLAFNQQGNMLEFLKSNYVDVGTRCGHRNTVKNMGKMIFDHILEETITTLKNSDKPISIIVDAGC